MSRFNFIRPVSYEEANNNVIAGLLADIPESASSLMCQLEKSQVTPDSYLDQYSFSSGAVSLYDYPECITQYMNIFNISPTIIDVTLSKKESSLPQVMLVIQFSDRSIAKIHNEDNTTLDDNYGVRIDNYAGELDNYRCTPTEVASLLYSIMASPGSTYKAPQEAILDNERLTNPQYIHAYLALADALERYTTYFSRVRSFTINLSNLQNDTNTAELKLSATRYCNGNTGYVITLNQEEVSDMHAKAIAITGQFEVFDEEVLDTASIDSFKYNLFVDGVLRDEIPAHISYSALHGAIVRARDTLLTQDGFDATDP